MRERKGSGERKKAREWEREIGNVEGPDKDVINLILHDNVLI